VRPEWGFSRRRFLGIVGAAGLPSLDFLASPDNRRHEHCKESGGAPPSNPEPQVSVLIGHQGEVLEVLAEQIVPADSDPGARDAGVLQYIDKLLSGDQASKRSLYAAGLEGVDQTSRLMFGRDFIGLSFEEQTAVLKAIEHGEGPGEIWKTVSSQEFFEMLWNHVLEGFYGPPREGGNKNYVSWKMIGFPPEGM
jgi:gluconate 2-dehydrogenase gamma chain